MKLCLFGFNFLVIFIMKIKVSVVLYCIIEEIIVEFFYVLYEKLKFWIKCLVGYFFKFI